MRVNIGIPVVRTDGRSVGRSVGHEITKFSGMGRFPFKFWVYQKAYKHFKKLNLLLNITSSGLIVVGAVAGGLTANPAILGSISGAGLVLKTFSETTDYKRKIEMSKFAFSTYQKILLDLRTALRRGHLTKTIS